MAEFSVKISDLTLINDVTLSDNDELIINDSVGSGITTKKIKVGQLVSYLMDKSLAFKGDITFEGSISPPAGKELDITCDDFTVKQELTLNSSATVSGFRLNSHVEDVSVSSVTDGQSLVWDSGVWVNQTLNVVEEAPMDGKAYVRQSGKWVLLTNLGEDKIGDVRIVTNMGGSPNKNSTYLFSMFTAGSVNDITYEWSYLANYNDGTAITFYDDTAKTTDVTFNTPGNYIVQCEAKSITATDSPQKATISVFVTNYDLIKAEDDRDMNQETNDYVLQD